ncbi:class I SAM-dependent DNA methyltransferase [Dactylosporangium sucinum]|uniref:DNA methylase adenine-specific domain-containing protein n=1 Tax=Dactylosporangium sucinum TaxID=1424081 RepID=A0A917TM60_9ACTN|nr:N-6 DNA methylase [Dactylosporangium sucinum]GGM27873.1 hypothetical protein GCM10007977_031450 [Dactylosporangium sucinum]
MQESPKVTAADIARLAGVGRAAVSNWRKRHLDFPAPVGGTASSPEFDLEHVEDWLRRQGKLPELSAEDRVWSHLVAAGDSLAATLGAAGTQLLAHHRGEPPPVSGDLPAFQGMVELASDRGAQAVFDELWSRFLQAQAWRIGVTPEALTELMIGLSGAAGGIVLDPACGTGNILRAAVRAGCTTVYGQEIDEHSAGMAKLWLDFRGVPGDVKVGDSLRADAYPGLAADAVVSNPPFGDTNWGHDELGYDPRWEYGTPPRTEPELAWVQHALAHLRPGGTAVLLMPPSAASRRAGRRIRSELLRRGALRAVIALPAKAAAPHGIPLHLWILRRPASGVHTPTHALLVDATDGDLTPGYDRTLAAFRAFDNAPDGAAEEPGFARAVPVIELLDEDVDLTPARRQPVMDARDTGERLDGVRDRLTALVAQLPGLIPDLVAGPEAMATTVSVADLAKSGALEIIGPVRAAAKRGDSVDDRVTLTGKDVVFNRDASGRVGDGLTPEIVLRPGDVVVPTVARQLTALVVTVEGPLLGANLYLLRPNPAALDPWFLAGQLRTTANERQAVSVSGAFRFDVRRALVPRAALEEQRRQGAAFRRLESFDEVLRGTATLGAELVRMTADGLARGVLRPPADVPGSVDLALPDDAAQIDGGVVGGGLRDDERRWFGLARQALASRVASSDPDASWNADDLVSQHAVSVSPQLWSAVSDWLPPFTQTAGPMWLSRRTVAAVAVDCRATGDWLPLLVTSFMWGQGNNGYGPTRLSWILDGKDGRPAPSLDEIRHRLAQAVQTLADRGAAEAYELLNGEGHIPELGPAFFTKFLYFAATAIGAPPPRPLVLDKVLAARMRWFWARRDQESYGVDAAKAAWLWQGPRWTTYRYRVYLSFLSRAAEQLSTGGQPWTADLVEYLLFAGNPADVLDGFPRERS